MYRRRLAASLRDAAASLPVVTLVGPRQSGKTTLARSCFPDHRYVSLERPDERAEDPSAFLGRFDGPVILDEVQRAPDLLSYIQGIVDEDDHRGAGRPGRFVLTGSQNLLLMEKVSQTLAGRTAIRTLLPLSVEERFGRPESDPRDPFSWGEAASGGSDPMRSDGDGARDGARDGGGDEPRRPEALPDLWELLVQGLFPRIHDRGLDAVSWLADYYRTYVERDLRDVLRVLDLDAFDRFTRLAAGRTGQVLNVSQLASDAGVSSPTAKQWLTALETGYVVTTLPSHHANFSKRIRRAPKLHFVDTGLACYLLGIRDAATLERHPLRGALFESFVVGEVRKMFLHSGEDAHLFHWRDAGGHEIDLLVDLGTRLVPIEVKSSRTFASTLMKSLDWWTALPENPASRGILVYAGDERRTRGEHVALPWFLA